MAALLGGRRIPADSYQPSSFRSLVRSNTQRGRLGKRPNSGQEVSHATIERWRFTCEPYYPDIAHFDMAPEVLFGTLRMFGVRFATEVCHALGNAQPNAVMRWPLRY
jgi:hypothetical protein